MTEGNIASRLVRNLYDYINSGREGCLRIWDPINEEYVLSKDYFQFEFHNLGLPNETSYDRIDPRRLPEKVASVYSLLKDERVPQECVNLSWRTFIDVDALEGILEDELPNIEPVKGPRSREYYVNGEKVLKINNGLRRMIFYPHQNERQRKTVYDPDEFALRLVDLVYEQEPFIFDVEPTVVPTLTINGELRMIPQLKLQQEMQKLNNRKLMAKILKANGQELQRMIEQYLEI